MSTEKQTPSNPRGDTGDMNPGDQAPAGTPGTGENICPDCAGTGRRGEQDCPTCGGTGKVIEGIGGA
jgi:DnaJ-class molecular chaperone